MAEPDDDTIKRICRAWLPAMETAHGQRFAYVGRGDDGDSADFWLRAEDGERIPVQHTRLMLEPQLERKRQYASQQFLDFLHRQPQLGPLCGVRIVFEFKSVPRRRTVRTRVAAALRSLVDMALAAGLPADFRDRPADGGQALPELLARNFSRVTVLPSDDGTSGHLAWYSEFELLAYDTVITDAIATKRAKYDDDERRNFVLVLHGYSTHLDSAAVRQWCADNGGDTHGFREIWLVSTTRVPPGTAVILAPLTRLDRWSPACLTRGQVEPVDGP